MSNNAEVAQEQPLLSHLIELRSRLLRIVLGAAFAFLPLAIFAQEIYTFVALPLINSLPEGSTMIATTVTAPFFTPYKLAMLLAFFVALPWTLYQVWAFVAPGLYKNEQRLVVPLLASSTLLFYAGVAFAYLVVFNVIFPFIVSFAPEGVAMMTDMSSYLDFVMAIFLGFGIAFETPVAIVLLVKTGFTTPNALAEKRAYVLVGAFAAGMLLTPPDVWSQTLLALPTYLLYEIGILVARVVVPESAEVDEQRAEQKSE